jgi:hypothetical protein
MPRPPDLNFIQGTSFVTNYFLLGCEAPSWAVIELNTEAQRDLAALFLVPDLSDIVQEVFDPRNERRRRPNRRGRKRPRGRWSFDPSTLIGRAIRGQLGPQDALQLGRYTWAFRLLDIYEGITFTIAVVDGVADVIFEQLWGILTMDPSKCVNMPRFYRVNENIATYNGGSTSFGPMNIAQAVFADDFPNTGQGCTADRSFTVSVGGYFFNDDNTDRELRLALGPSYSEARGWSDQVTLAPGEGKYLSAFADFDPDENCVWGLNMYGAGFIKGVNLQAFGFVNDAWPWQWGE